jgi:hypothetical protein
MKFRKYLRKTLRKGSLTVKAIKSFRSVKHTLYAKFGIRIGNYQHQSGEEQFVGYFDKDRLIHTEPKYRHLFNSDHLYNGGNFREMKRESISIVKIEDHILLKKTFSGFRRYDLFYNELICLNRLKHNEYDEK